MHDLEMEGFLCPLFTVIHGSSVVFEVMLDSILGLIECMSCKM